VGHADIGVDYYHYYKTTLLLVLTYAVFIIWAWLAPRKSFDILALYKSDYYYYIISGLYIVCVDANEQMPGDAERAVHRHRRHSVAAVC